jgi:hypothetical protein
MDKVDLPSSVYQPYEENYGLWPDDISPNALYMTEAEERPYPDDMDFNAYGDPLLMSDFSGSAATWNEPQFSFTQDLTGIQPVQDETRRHVANLVCRSSGADVMAGCMRRMPK